MLKRRLLSEKAAPKSAPLEEEKIEVKTEPAEEAVVIEETSQSSNPEITETVKPVEAVSTIPDDEVAESKVEKKSGLQIVEMPKAPVVEETEDAILEASEETLQENEVVEEKVEAKEEKPKQRGLRVVAMPTAKPEKKESEGQEQYSQGDEDKKSEKTTSKKRIGGLASMVTGKKASLNRSRAINNEKADNELKSYGVLNNMGTPVTLSVKRKKTFTGVTSKTKITEVKDSKRIVHLHNGTTAAELAQNLVKKFQSFANKCLDINLLVKKDDYMGISSGPRK